MPNLISMILADIILASIGVFALLIASLTDLKKKEVPDWLNFSVIAAALGIRLIHAVAYSDYKYFLYGVIGFVTMFSLGMILYYGRLWGGGDTKLLMGLGALFGTSPFFYQSKYPFLAMLLMNIIIVGSFYSLGYAIILFFRNRKRAILEMRHQAKRMKFARLFYLLASITAMALSIIFKNNFSKILSLTLAGFLLFYIHLLIFIRSIEKVGMYKAVPVSQLTEGDWVAEDIISHGKLICSKKGLGLEKNQIYAIKRAGIKKVIVKEGVAFVPSFFIGLVSTLAFGSFLF